MSPRKQDLMERYIYAVVRRLPRAMREETGNELRELIGDMLDADPEAGMEGVLRQLGDPAEFARRYSPPGQYLIGPEYFENYKWLLKIVLLCAAVPVFLVSAASGAAESWPDGYYQALARGITGGIIDAVSAALSGFGAVTLLFAAAERYERLTGKKKSWTPADLKEKPAGPGKFSAAPPSWHPASLSPVPDKNARISRGDSIVSIVFIVIFCALLIFVPDLFFLVVSREGVEGNWMLADQTARIPLFNLAQWGRILPVFVLILGIGLADEILRLVKGCYCRAVLVSNILCAAAQIALSVWLLKFLPLFNPGLPEQLAEANAALGDAAWLPNWNTDIVTSGLLTFIILLTLLEVGTTVYKTARYAPKG